MYIPRNAARNFGRALDEGDPLATGVAVTLMIVMGGMIVSFPILAISSCHKQKGAIKALNAQIEQDINEKTNANIQSFTTNKIILEDSDSKYIIRFNGVVIDSKQSNNASSATYELTENNFKILQEVVDYNKHANNGVLNKNIRDFSSDILFKVLEIVKESEFLSAEINNVNLIENSEMTVEVSKPEIDEKAKNVSYTLSLTKMENNNLKMAWFKVSAPLSKELKESPSRIYELNKDELKTEKIDELMRSGVDFVYKQKNHFMAVPTI